MTQTYRFLVDAQLPPALCKWLRDKGHEAQPVTQWRAGDTPDSDIARHCAQHRLVVISKNEDFCSLLSKHELQLVWLRIGNATNRNLNAWLEPRWPQIESLLAKDDRLIEVR